MTGTPSLAFQKVVKEVLLVSLTDERAEESNFRKHHKNWALHFDLPLKQFLEVPWNVETDLSKERKAEQLMVSEDEAHRIKTLIVKHFSLDHILGGIFKTNKTYIPRAGIP